MSSEPDRKEDQKKRFLETARKLKCDEDEKVFTKKLKKIAETKKN